MNAIDLLEEQIPRRSKERWGRGLTDEELASQAAQILEEKCRCGWRSGLGPFEKVHALYVAHAQAGCR